jgi:hypothetical protein
VVPVVSAGTHEQLIVLSDGRKIARRLRLKRLLRSEGFPIVLALPWGLTSGFFPYLPLPAQTTIQFGPPIGWPSLGPSDAEEPQVVLRCYEEVRSTMQHMLDELTRDRLPWVGTRPSWLR